MPCRNLRTTSSPYPRTNLCERVEGRTWEFILNLPKIVNAGSPRKARKRQQKSTLGTPTRKQKPCKQWDPVELSATRQTRLEYDRQRSETQDRREYRRVRAREERQKAILVAGEGYVTRAPGASASERMAPDLLIAFNIEPETYRESNGYDISEQEKPPDFVLEIASRSTGEHNVVDKRPAYAGLGIPEYWRFDETGEFHGTRLAEGGYEPVPTLTVGEGVLQGCSSVLNLLIRWDHGQLGWHDPETGQHIATFARNRPVLRVLKPERKAPRNRSTPKKVPGGAPLRRRADPGEKLANGLNRT